MSVLASQIAELRTMTGQQLENTLRGAGFGLHTNATRCLMAENAKLRAALEYYADRDGEHEVMDWAADGGRRAQEALA